MGDATAWLMYEDWAVHGGRACRAFMLEDSPYDKVSIVSAVEAAVGNGVQWEEIPEGFAFSSERDIQPCVLAHLSRTLKAIIRTVPVYAT